MVGKILSSIRNNGGPLPEFSIDRLNQEIDEQIRKSGKLLKEDNVLFQRDPYLKDMVRARKSRNIRKLTQLKKIINEAHEEDPDLMTTERCLFIDKYLYEFANAVDEEKSKLGRKSALYTAQDLLNDEIIQEFMKTANISDEKLKIMGERWREKNEIDSPLRNNGAEPSQYPPNASHRDAATSSDDMQVTKLKLDAITAENHPAPQANKGMERG